MAASVRGVLVLPFDSKFKQEADAQRKTSIEAEDLINQIPLDANPYVEAVRDFLKRSKILPGSVEKRDADKSICWQVRTEKGFVLMITVYRADDEVFLWQEVAISEVPEPMLKDVSYSLMAYQYGFYFPFRLAFAPDSGIVTLQLRSYANALTEESWKIRLDSALPVAEDVMSLLRNDYGLKPLVEEEQVDDTI